VVNQIKNENKGESSINPIYSKRILTDYDIIRAKNFVFIHENCTVRFNEKNRILKIVTDAHKPIVLDRIQKNIFLTGFDVSFPSFGEFTSKSFEDSGYRLAIHPPPRKYKNNSKILHPTIHYIPTEMKDFHLYDLQKKIEGDYRKRVDLASRMVKRYLSLTTPVLLAYAEKRLDKDAFEDIERDILYHDTRAEKWKENLTSIESYEEKDMIKDLKKLQGDIEGGYMRNSYIKVIREATKIEGYPLFKRENPYKTRKSNEKRHPLNVAADYIGHCLYDISRAALTMRGLDPNIPILHHSFSSTRNKKHGQKLAMDLADFNRGLIMLNIADLFTENSVTFKENLLPYLKDFKDCDIFISSEPDNSKNFVQNEQGLFEKGQRSSIPEDVVYDSERDEFLSGGVKRLFNAFYQVLQMPYPYVPGMTILDSFDYHIDFIIENLKELATSGKNIGDK